MRQLVPIFLVLLVTCPISAQEIADTSAARSIFDVSSAWNYVDQATRNEELWRTHSDKLVEALQRLLDQTREPYDSTLTFLQANDFSNVPVQRGKPVIVDTIDVKWINDSTFVLDPRTWNTNLYLRVEERYKYPIDLSTLTLSKSLLDENGMLDSSLFIPDTIFVTIIDTAAIRELDIKLFSYLNGIVTPPLSDNLPGRLAQLSRDHTKVFYSVPQTTWMADESSPFYILKDQFQLDSLQQAINTLLDFNLQRDSTLLFIDDMFGQLTPYWLTTGRNETFRYWVKNFNNDSLTLWIGNPGTRQISLLMEDDVDLKRMTEEKIIYLPSFLEQPKRALREMYRECRLPAIYFRNISQDSRNLYPLQY